ncbi:MAG: PAS domain S-box protein, partial [Hymenobacter sp.]
MKRLTPQAAFRALRQRAEQRRLNAASSLPAEGPPQVQQLVQELQLSQLELETQYEELLQAQANAERSATRYADLYNAAPLGYCTLDLRGILRQLNQHASQLLGAAPDELLGQRLAAFVAPASRGALADFLAQLWAAPGQRASCALRLGRADGPLLMAQLEGVVEAPRPGYPLT